MKEFYSIGELVKELNINKETIRYYENIGLLDKPQKDENGYRLYSKDNVDKVRFILIAKGYGFSLKEIKILLSKIYSDILGGDINSIKNIVEQKIDEIDSKMEELERTKRLLQKIKSNILSEIKECSGDIEDLLKEKCLTV